MLKLQIIGAIVAQWIRLWTLNCEVSSLNLLAATVVPLGKAFYPHYLVPRKGHTTSGPLVTCLLSSFTNLQWPGRNKQLYLKIKNVCNYAKTTNYWSYCGSVDKTMDSQL